MSRKAIKTRRTKRTARWNLAAFLVKDGPMRAVVAVAGVLAGVLATHGDLGRRLDAVAVQVQLLSQRVSDMEKCIGRQCNDKK